MERDQLLSNAGKGKEVASSNESLSSKYQEMKDEMTRMREAATLMETEQSDLKAQLKEAKDMLANTQRSLAKSQYLLKARDSFIFHWLKKTKAAISQDDDIVAQRWLDSLQFNLVSPMEVTKIPSRRPTKGGIQVPEDPEARSIRLASIDADQAARVKMQTVDEGTKDA